MYWNTKPPPGPLDKTTERIYLVLGVAMTVPVLGVVVVYCFGLYHWFIGH